jgi:hypothetical protein
LKNEKKKKYTMTLFIRCKAHIGKTYCIKREDIMLCFQTSNFFKY